MHDMQTTEDYILVLDTNLEFDGQVRARLPGAHKPPHLLPRGLG